MTEYNEEDLHKYEGEYSEKKLDSKLKRFAKKAGLECVYYVLLLIEAMKSDTISAKDKAIIAGALGYFILPFDLIPDIVVGVGYADDIGMLTVALTKLGTSITPDIKKAALTKLHQWFTFDDSEFSPKI